MTTLEGFLSSPGPGLPPRMTPGQKRLVLDAVTKILAAIPDSRACVHCDYFRGGICLNFDGHPEIPKDVLEAGCDSFQDHGAPF